MIIDDKDDYGDYYEMMIMTTMIMMMFRNKYLQFWPNDFHKQSLYVVLNLWDERIA